MARSDETIDAGHRTRQLVGRALGVTSSGDNSLSGLPGPFQLQQHGARFLPRWFDEPAGIDDEKIGLFGGGGSDETGPVQQHSQTCAVHQILWTTKRDEIKAEERSGLSTCPSITSRFGTETRHTIVAKLRSRDWTSTKAE
jgi:hypothetical protein